MAIQEKFNTNEIISNDQDKYQLALDEVIKQMNLLSNNPSNEHFRLAYEKARQKFIQISNIEKDQYDKLIYSRQAQNQVIDLSQDRIQHIEQSWFYTTQKIYICYIILIFLFLTITLICIIIVLK